MTLRYHATAPSNIAFLKYWGKADEARQWPANDSLSMTLTDLQSQTTAQLAPDLGDHEIILNERPVQRGQRQGDKIFKHLDHLAKVVGRTTPLRVTSRNTFPTGSGIASSASGLAALTISALAAWLEAGTWEDLTTKGFDRDRLAHLARQGSGSAGRSLYGGIVAWNKGESPEKQQITPLWAADHWPLADVIVLFSEDEKSVSSTAAHRAAWTSPLFAPRLAALPHRRRDMEAAIAERDLERLGPLLEQEALEMHGVIMSATPAVHYFGKETGAFLASLRQWRQDEQIPVYFTIDAGPNVHLILEQKYLEKLLKILQQRCPQHQLLVDRIGPGPTLTAGP